MSSTLSYPRTSAVSKRQRFRLLAMLLAVFCPHGKCLAAESWLTGPALKKALEQPVSAAWAGKPLRDALRDLSKAHQVAIDLDRRVDPGQKVELKQRDVPLGQLLTTLAANRSLRCSQLDSVAVVGPDEQVARLRTLAELRREEAAKLPAAARPDWVKQKAWQWQELAQPRQLVEEAAQAAKCKVDGLDQIPLDLWPAADLPPLTLVDRLTLVLNQFELTFRFEDGGRRITLVPAPADAAIERTYPGGKDPEALVKRLSELLPKATVQLVGGKVLVRGTLEDHERMAGGKPNQPAAAGETPLANIRVKSFNVDNVPLRAVLEELRKQLGLTLTIDEDGIKKAGKSLDGFASVKLNNATLDELLEASLFPHGLTFERKDRTVKIVPKE